MGKHRAEDRPEGKSTSEAVRGKRDDASQSKHRPPADKPTEEGEKK